MITTQPDFDAGTVLPEDVPVTMPELPATLTINTAQQFKALGDPTRSLILDIIKHQPATAKYIGERLKIPPGTIGHHLQVLEAAGLAQVVARRLVHGIVAKYYTRTARLFLFDFPPEVTTGTSTALRFITEARDQLAEALLSEQGKDTCKTAFPHARLSPERAEAYNKRLFELIYEFSTEPSDPDGLVYGLFTAFFVAPPYLQSDSALGTSSVTTEDA